MSTLLVYLRGSMSFNRTPFPPRLYVYDDLLIYRKRHLTKTREITMSYNQLSKVNLIRGIFFGAIELATTGKENIDIKWVNKKKATMAKKIIDQKIYHAHARHKPEETQLAREVKEYERSVNRLKELHNRGEISKKDMDRMRRDLLKKFN
jgi:hypothetical protein